MVRRILLAIAFVAVLTAIPFGSAYAQCAGTGGPPGLTKGLCVYSVKFVCGLQLPIPPSQTHALETREHRGLEPPGLHHSGAGRFAFCRCTSLCKHRFCLSTLLLSCL